MHPHSPSRVAHTRHLHTQHGRRPLGQAFPKRMHAVVLDEGARHRARTVVGAVAPILHLFVQIGSMTPRIILLVTGLNTISRRLRAL